MKTELGANTFYCFLMATESKNGFVVEGVKAGVGDVDDGDPMSLPLVPRIDEVSWFEASVSGAVPWHPEWRHQRDLRLCHHHHHLHPDHCHGLRVLSQLHCWSKLKTNLAGRQSKGSWSSAKLGSFIEEKKKVKSYWSVNSGWFSFQLEVNIFYLCFIRTLCVLTASNLWYLCNKCNLHDFCSDDCVYHMYHCINDCSTNSISLFVGM